MTRDENVAVVVLSHNKKDDVLLALKSVYDSDYPNINVVVIDNDSSDGSADVLARRYPATPLIRNQENTGVSKGRNLGWRYAKEHFDFAYIVFIDDDSEVAPDYFTQIVKTYREHPEVGVVTAKAFVAKGSDVLCSVGLSVNLYTGVIRDIGATHRDIGQYGSPAFRDACTGFAFSVRRALFDHLGGFDENYSPYGWEDADFCLRARKAEYETYYCPDAIVVHKGTKIGRDPISAYERSKTKNLIYLLRQHTNLVQKCTCALCIPIKGLFVIAQMLAKGHGKVVLEQLRGLLEGLAKAGYRR